MPSGFENVLAPAAELWAPLQYDPSLPAQGRAWGHHLRTVGRLRPGVSVEQATREINALGRAVLERARIRRRMTPRLNSPSPRCRTSSRAASSRRCSPSSAR